MEEIQVPVRNQATNQASDTGRRHIRSVSMLIFALACMVLGLQAMASRKVNIDERSLPLPGLHQIPMELGAWKADGEQSLDASVTEYLRPDEYIMRNYFNPSSKAPAVNLFVAYFKSLQNSYGPHSPRVCLPGNGWLEQSSRIRKVQVPGRPEGIDVNQFLLEKGSDRILVWYWYQNSRAVWAEEMQAKVRLLPDLLRYKRSDVSLVRLVMATGTDSDRDLGSLLEYTNLVFPGLARQFNSVQ
jgi:EpsI family protein